jgi:hypothetical protein
VQQTEQASRSPRPRRNLRSGPLSSTVPDERFGDGGGLHDAASVLRRVNGVARTLSSDVRPVGLTGRFSDETGWHHQVVLADSRYGLAPTQ